MALTKTYLLKMVLSGIKNIDKEIELSFYKKVLPKKIEYQNYNIKAIYGANGAGKTAIIYAAEIYKQFVLDKDYLALSLRNSNLINLINQSTNTLSIEMTFAVLSEDNTIQDVYSHAVSLHRENNLIVIEKELLKKLHGNRLNDLNKYEIIYEVKNGRLTKPDNIYLEEISKNVLSDRSVESNVFINYINNNIGQQFPFSDILKVYNFAQNLTIVINGTDKNYININYILRQIKMLAKAEAETEPEIFSQMLAKGKVASSTEIIIDKKMYKTFENDMKALCKFIQVFKSDLKTIDIKKDELTNLYVCYLTFVYTNKTRIAMQFESTGIKKLMSLFYALRDVEDGKTVFIDEFDANIHDVVLVKLIGFMQNYTAGQFVFTTHNLGPMDVLQNAKHSIDFLSNDSRLVSWAKIGNCSAANVYKNGLIKYSPFNIESFDFLGVFGNESNE